MNNQVDHLCTQFAEHKVAYKDKKDSLAQIRKRNLLIADAKRREQRGLIFNELRNLVDRKKKSKVDIPNWKKSTYLMIAEWFLKCPDDFHEKFRVKLCPKGVHVLVFAQRKRTFVFNRTNFRLLKTYSSLPGGSSISPDRGYATLLDCIVDRDALNHKDGKIDAYVIDILYLKQTSYENESLVFRVVESYSCEIENLRKLFSEKPPYEMEGIYFYHMDGQYTPGPTPLVGWIRSYMIPELIPTLYEDTKFNLHHSYIANKPRNYTNYIDDIEEFDAVQSKKQKSGTIDD